MRGGAVGIARFRPSKGGTYFCGNIVGLSSGLWDPDHIHIRRWPCDVGCLPDVDLQHLQRRLQPQSSKNLSKEAELKVTDLR